MLSRAPLLCRFNAYATVTEYTGGSLVATVDHVAPASPDPNTSPEVAPK